MISQFSIIYEAIASGDLTGTIHQDTFSRTGPGDSMIATGTAKVLVICPYCGAKTEQGRSNCQKCKADL